MSIAIVNTKNWLRLPKTNKSFRVGWRKFYCLLRISNYALIREIK